MPRKPKFRPVISRIKLNPEQAVLACDCYDGHDIWGNASKADTGGITQSCWIEGTEKMIINEGTCVLEGKDFVGSGTLNPEVGAS